MVKKAEVGSVIAEAFKNSKLNIPFVLDGAFRKHGNTKTACGSRFCKEGCYTTQGGVEHALFYDMQREWRVVSEKDNVLIAEVHMPLWEAETAAVKLESLPADRLCKVKALGAHPTLVTFGHPTPTNIVSAVIYMDAGKDPDLEGMGLDGKPILVTWHPGKALPPSHPTDCEVGDIMTVEDALKKGWRVAALEASQEALDLF